MFHYDKSGFGKRTDCPSSDRLLAFRQKKLGSFASDLIRRHIDGCDFCSAELEFYQHLRALPEENIKAGKIPSHLYELAEAILTNRSSGVNALETIIGKRNEED